jgi:hypothetical protein
MNRKITILLLIPLMFLQSCLGDPDPLPETIDTYHYYYNNLLESYDLRWDINEVLIGSGHSYGFPAQAIVSLDMPEQDVLIRASNSDNGQLIDSLSYTMFENNAYMIAVMGTEEEPHLICETLDPRAPSPGMVKYRFLQTSEALGPVDIYVGGDLEEHLVLEAMDYTQLSDYFESSQLQLWTSVIVTPASMLPADSTILEYTANNVFEPGRIHLCILEHANSSPESSFQITVDDHPVY